VVDVGGLSVDGTGKRGWVSQLGGQSNGDAQCGEHQRTGSGNAEAIREHQRTGSGNAGQAREHQCTGASDAGHQPVKAASLHHRGCGFGPGLGKLVYAWSN
jgi:hypothetical protein